VWPPDGPVRLATLSPGVSPLSEESVLYSEQRLRELVLYISAKSEDDPLFDSIKLNKILFAADMFAYAELGHSITGADYVKRSYGPMPQQLEDARERMVDEGDLAMQYVPYAPYEQKRPVALRKPCLEAFTAQEIALVGLILDTFRPTDTRLEAGWPNGVSGWGMASVGETIPYPLVFLSDQPISPYEMELGRQMAREHDWDVF
jgi:hypothetical protein